MWQQGARAKFDAHVYIFRIATFLCAFGTPTDFFTIKAKKNYLHVNFISHQVPSSRMLDQVHWKFASVMNQNIWHLDVWLPPSNKRPFVVFVIIITRCAALLARCPMLARPLLDPRCQILDNYLLDARSIGELTSRRYCTVYVLENVYTCRIAWMNVWMSSCTHPSRTATPTLVRQVLVGETSLLHWFVLGSYLSTLFK